MSEVGELKNLYKEQFAKLQRFVAALNDDDIILGESMTGNVIDEYVIWV